VESSGKRTRGPNRSTPWARNPDDGVSVLRLALDTSDPLQRRRIETMFAGAYQIQRALKRGARASAKAYWAAHHERAADPAAVRDRLGLTRTGLEYAAYAHLDSAPHLRRFVTKALAMHLADSVWTGTERHLFRDGSGHRHGLPRVGRWRDFTRLPGRARSHKKPTKWETFRLHGSLAGHRAAYANARGTFTQPRRLHAVEPGDGGWWSYDGPLAVVFTGLGDGTLVLPVRLPTAPCNQPILDHHLADPTRWHKIDLVRYPAPHASGGWRYEAHLMVLTTPYVSPSATARRSSAALATMDRRTGIDVNVSNITVASHDSGRDLRVSRIARDGGAPARDRSLRRRERRRQRELERSRRAMNRAQYQLSKRQQKRARRREARGLPPIEVIPMGPRLARADGAPLQSYRRDQASKTFLRNLRAAAAGAASAAQARRDRAREIAAKIVAAHGYQLVVEDTSIAAWSRSWGRAIGAFTPSTLVVAIDREARTVAALAGATGGVVRASTRTTALSQHCPCGARVDKRLADRVHRCSVCGLVGDRDAVAALLASFVRLAHRDEPGSARVDYDASSAVLPQIKRALSPYQGWQDTLSESTDLSARDGSFVAWRTSTPRSVVVARRTVGTASRSTRDETGNRQTTSERARMRTNMLRKYAPVRAYLRDNP